MIPPILFTPGVLALFFLTCFSFGYVFAVSVLGVRTRLAVFGMTSYFGVSVFIIATNALGHALALPLSSWLVLGVMLIAMLALGIWRRPRLPSGEKLPRPVWWTLWAVILVGGLVNARFLGSDPWLWTHFPLPATMIAGNFPPLMPMDPTVVVGYHYAPALLTAVLSLMSGLSLAAAYALQPILGIAGVLFFVGATVWELTRSWRAVLWAALLGFLGTGFAWLRGIFFVTDLVNHFLLGHRLASPFRGLHYLFDSNLTGPPMLDFGHRTFTMGFPSLFGLLYCLLILFRGPSSRLATVGWWLASLVFGLLLALSMEASLVVLFPSLFLFAVFLWWDDRRGKQTAFSWRRVAAVSACVLGPTLLVALVQGGVLSTVFVHHDSSIGGSFSVAFDGRVRSLTRWVGLWEWEFWQDFGLPLILFPVVAAYLWRRRLEWSFFLLLWLIALFHLTIPMVVRFFPREDDIARLFYVFTSIASLLAGILIADTLLTSKNSRKRWIGGAALACMLLVSAFYSVVRLALPTYRLEPAPLFAAMPPVSPDERRLYDWVKDHTTLEDFFYIRMVEPKDPTRYLFDNAVQQLDRILFMTYTGRFNPGPLTWPQPSPAQAAFFHTIEQRCDVPSLKKLTIRYLVVETKDRAAWFASRCDSSQWTLRYDGGSGVSLYPRIYELTGG